VAINRETRNRETDTVKTIFRLARNNGWTGAGVELGDSTNGDDVIEWPYVTGKEHKPNGKHIGNVVKLLEHKSWRLRHNEFTSCDEVDRGDGFAPLDDIAVLQLHAYAGTHGFCPEEKMFRNHLKVLASETCCHPVREYLAGLTWDGKARLDRWAVDYLGAEDTPLHRATGRVMLLGAVHRVMNPGCQYDYMPVLEGKQGTFKSTSLRVLGGEWYTDALKIGSDHKVTIEQTSGVGIAEMAELAGMAKHEKEAVKSHVTTRVDRARLAYGHFTSTVPRQWIMVGTSNSGQYLRDETGNRRFLPLPVGAIGLDALRRDRGNAVPSVPIVPIVFDTSGKQRKQGQTRFLRVCQNNGDNGDSRSRSRPLRAGRKQPSV
jgi:hypothetical protein